MKRLVFSFPLCLLLVASAFGQYVTAGFNKGGGVVSVAVDHSGGGATSSQVASLTWTQTVSASANFMLMSITTGNGNAISTLTVNGSSTNVTAVTSQADGNGSTLTSLYAMTSPPSGTVTMVATPTTTDLITATSMSFTGTNGTYATAVKASGKNTTGQPTASAVSVPANDLVVSTVGADLSGLFSTYTFTAGGSQTSQVQQGGSGSNDGGNVMGTLASTGTVVMSWTIATGATPWFWSEIVVDVHHQ